MTVDPQIAIARPSDASAIAVMSPRPHRVRLEWRWRTGRVARAIDDPDTNVAVLRRDEELIGFGIMEYLDDEAYLILFAVAKSSQRQGVGSALLRWLEAAAGAAGSQRIRVDTRRENIGADAFTTNTGTTSGFWHRACTAGRSMVVRLEKWLRFPMSSDA
jgi:ribosomal-protein-alanine N-acetyltransferase